MLSSLESFLTQDDVREEQNYWDDGSTTVVDELVGEEGSSYAVVSKYLNEVNRNCPLDNLDRVDDEVVAMENHVATLETMVKEKVNLSELSSKLLTNHLNKISRRLGVTIDSHSMEDFAPDTSIEYSLEGFREVLKKIIDKVLHYLKRVVSYVTEWLEGTYKVYEKLYHDAVVITRQVEELPSDHNLNKIRGEAHDAGSKNITDKRLIKLVGLNIRESIEFFSSGFLNEFMHSGDVLVKEVTSALKSTKADEALDADEVTQEISTTVTRVVDKYKSLGVKVGTGKGDGKVDVKGSPSEGYSLNSIEGGDNFRGHALALPTGVLLFEDFSSHTEMRRLAYNAPTKFFFMEKTLPLGILSGESIVQVCKGISKTAKNFTNISSHNPVKSMDNVVRKRLDTLLAEHSDDSESSKKVRLEINWLKTIITALVTYRKSVSTEWILSARAYLTYSALSIKAAEKLTL